MRLTHTNLVAPLKGLSAPPSSGGAAPSRSPFARRPMGEKIAGWLAARAKALNEFGGPARGTLVVPAAWLLVGFIAATDLAMGSEITLRFLYCIPIVLLVAARGTAPAVVMAVVCDICWLAGDSLAGASYSSLLVPVGNGLITLAVYLTVIWLLAALLTLHREMEQRVRERTEALTAEMAERNRLEREIISLSDKERWSLGHDLHDGLGQHFTASAMAAQSLARGLEDDGHAAADVAYRLVRMIEDGIGQTRRLAKGLLLVTVEEDELGDALREMVVSSAEHFRVPCDLRIAGTIGGTDATVATHLFRIAQEAVRNAARHGKPSRVEVWVSGDKSGIFMTIRDNGTGLAPEARRGVGMGLRIMEHRAKMIGADFDLRRPTEGGTLVECRWPRPGASTP
jgi:signal transduction histidine kinase